ncbi:MAG: DUF1501 domain-containing protein [Blastocatellia bacterium]|nr:DUF1501 domain-containing protein [Blastocatellia bacterium]
MAHSRRDFLKGSISLLSLSLASPKIFFSQSGSVFAQSGSPRNILVIVEMMGGNDGLNTFVPYTDQTYYSSRPTLAIPEANVLKVNERLGMNPALGKLKGLYDEGKVAIVQNTGYPQPDLSHFRSRAIYQRADPTTQEANEQLGWLGKYGDLKLATTGNPLSLVNIGDEAVPKAFVADKVNTTSISSFEAYQFQTDAKYPTDRMNQTNSFKKTNSIESSDPEFVFIGDNGIDAIESADSLQAGIKKYTPAVEYPKDRLGPRLQMAAQIIAAELGSQIIYTSYSGFDTHSSQKEDHQELLTSFSDGISAFYNDLTRLNKADNVIVMAFSEFGRRVRENGSQGTDHGAAGPMMVIGNGIKGGLYGNVPNLSKLDNAGNLIFDIDFRSVYSTIVRDWLQADPTAVVGGNFENLGFIK